MDTEPTTPDRTDPTNEDPPTHEQLDASDDLVEAIGTATEAFEYIERARGHLYSLHQLIGRADFLFGDAADQLEQSGATEDAARLRAEVVGRNVLDGRWTFQIVEEFDDLYYDTVAEEIRRLRATHVGGRRHEHESRLKDRRRSVGRPGHERRPPMTDGTGADAGS